MKGQCHLTQIPVRGEARSGAEMVTQLIYGETYEVLETQGDWYYIRMDFDSYEGWLSESSYAPVRNNPKPQVQQELFSVLPLENEPLITSMGSEVFAPLISEMKEQDPLALAQRFLGVPYLWGGRTFAGIDCSGLMQIVFKAMERQIPRDASQQVKEGRAVRFVDRQPGDLAFFESDYKVTHVGLLLDADRIIHAHGKVRIDRFDKKGIYNAEKEEHTHHLHSIRRLG